MSIIAIVCSACTGCHISTSFRSWPGKCVDDDDDDVGKVDEAGEGKGEAVDSYPFVR